VSLARKFGQRRLGSLPARSCVQFAYFLLLLAFAASGCLGQDAPDLTAPADIYASQRTTPNSDANAQLFSVSGKVVNAVTGEPIPRAKVSFYGGPQHATLTDADGGFHFDRVPAGQIQFSAEKPGYFSPEQLSVSNLPTRPITVYAQTPAVVLQLTPEAVIEGRALDEKGEPVDGLTISVLRRQVNEGVGRWMAIKQVQTDEDGEYHVAGLEPGRYLAKYAPRIRGGIFAQTRTKAYSAGYYPNSPTASGATPITAVAGRPVNIDFALRQTPLYAVSGTVSGAPADRAFVTVLDEDEQQVSAAEVTENGFRLLLPPGRYVLQAMAQLSEGAPAMQSDTKVEVSRDLQDVRLLLGASATLNVSVSAQSTRENTGSTAPQMFQLVPLNGDLGHTATAIRDSKTHRLRFTDVASGDYRLQMPSEGSGWYMEAASFGGRDVLNEPVHVSSGQSAELNVVVRDDSAKVSGTVESVGPNEVNITVLLVPENRPWEPVRIGAMNGKFEMSGIAPGVYKAVALDRVDNVEYADPAVLDRLLTHAVSLNLGAGEEKQLNLAEVHAQ
jgi:Carboxypeptidase regulatory-like domain